MNHVITCVECGEKPHNKSCRLAVELITHEGGATSSRVDERFDLVPLAGVRAAARRAAFGAKRHGEWNWRKSRTDQFAKERLNHMIQHVFKFSETFAQEDLDAIILNAMMLADMKEAGCLTEGSNISGSGTKK